MKKNISQVELSNKTGLHRNTVNSLVRRGVCSNSTKVIVRTELKIKKNKFDKLLESVD